MVKASFNLYNTMLILSFFFNIIVVKSLCKKKKIMGKEIFYLLFYELLGIIFGGKYYTLITQYLSLKNKSFLSLGLSATGCLIGAIIMVLIYAIQFKKNFKDILNIIITPVPLLYSVGKIGCFLVGCCRGLKYNGPFKVRYPYHQGILANETFFPIQIIESIVFFFFFLYLFKRYKNKKNNIGLFFLLGGIFKFLLDFLRYTHTKSIFTINQFSCIISIIFGLYLIKKEEKNDKIF